MCWVIVVGDLKGCPKCGCKAFYNDIQDFVNFHKKRLDINT